MEFLKSVFHLYIERRDFFLKLLDEHLIISGISIIISTVLGITLGIIISDKKRLVFPIMGLTSILYTIPSIAILGFLVSITGVGDITAIITLSIYGLLPIVSNTYTGIRNIDGGIIEAGQGMGSTKFQVLYKIKLPLALPVIFSGFRNMVVMTIALCGIASFIGAGGLGVAIWRGITTNNGPMTCAGSLLIASIALIIDSILSKIEKGINNRIHGKRKKVSKNKKGALVKILLIVIIVILIVEGFMFKNSLSKNTINIASKPTTEEYILSEILGQLIKEKTDLNVEIMKGIGGGTANIHPAMVKGEIDLYPEYTGTSWEYVLKKSGFRDKDSVYEELKKEYKDKFNFNWIGLYGFNSTYNLIVDKEFAEKNNLETNSDLAKISDKLNFGANYDFYEREDGYDALAKKYGFKFKNKLDLDIGLRYEALSSNKVDVINAFSTDAQLYKGKYKILADDKEFFPSYLAGTIVRQEVLDMNPELENVLKLLDNKITEKDIIEMNYKVEIEKVDESKVARDFLINKGLISRWWNE